MTVSTIIQNGTIPTLCRQCDMRCGIRVHVRGGRAQKITGAAEHPQNTGRLCPKAVSALELVNRADRLHTPLKRLPDGGFQEIGYHQAMDEIAARIIALRDAHDPRALAVWTGEALGFLQQEDYARRFIHAFGSPNYTSADSVCFSSRYIAYRLTMGYWAAFPDFANAGLIVLWGANPGVTHPPFMRGIDAARKQGAVLVVVDPRSTEAARKADRHLQIRPGTDGALALGLARRLIHRGQYDRDFVGGFGIGFDAFSAGVEPFTPEYVSAQTGLAPGTVEELAALFARCRPRVVNYVGIALEHQVSGTDTTRAIVCLSGMCGAVDVPGGDPWPSPAGLRDLTLYRERPLEDRGPVGADRFPLLYRYRRQAHSISAMDYMLGRGAYPLRGLVLTGANPAITNPNSAKVARALASLDLLVVRDLFMTATARHAHYVLPAASFLERTELHVHPHLLRVSLAERVLDAPGTTDEYTFWRDLAQRLDLGRYFPWEDETAVNRWLLEPTGITLENLRAHPEGCPYAGREFEKYRRQPLPTPSGKFEFASQTLESLGFPAVPSYEPPPYLSGPPDPDHPLILITGARHPVFLHSRIIDYRCWDKRPLEPVCDMHPADAAALGVADGEPIRLSSATGSLRVTARVVAPDAILPGLLQMLHGWDAANANILSDDRDLDPVSGFPNFKRIAVRVTPVAAGPAEIPAG